MYAPPGGPPPYGAAPPPYYRPPQPYPPPLQHLQPHAHPLPHLPHPAVLGAPPSLPFAPPPPNIVHLSSAAPPVHSAAPVETITRAAQSAEERLAATVYVGKLPPGLEDDFVRRVLSLFGRLLLWRRQVQDTGVPLGFGFADFENGECVARAVRVLNGFRLGEKELLVKPPSAEAQKALDAYLAKRQVPPSEAEEDNALRARIRELVVLRERGELPPLTNNGMDVVSVVAGEAPAEDKDRIVSAQIKMFRETTARFEKEKRAGASSAADVARERERETERKERLKRREAREREREKERTQRAADERDARERERRVEEREREKETQKRKEEDEGEGTGPRSARERERRRREREREEKEDIDDKRREELERHAIENPAANAPLRFGSATIAPPATATMSPSSPVAPQSPSSTPTPLASSATISLSLAAVAARKRATAAPAQVFSLEEEQAQWVPRKKRELVKLGGQGGGATGGKDTVDLAALAEKVPKTKEALYAWSIDWAAFDEADLAEKRLRPWIVKKVIEYVGEEEALLRDFILEKLRAHTPPAEFEAALVEVLDAEAGPFVQKLWRFLAFELLRLGATK